MNDRLLASSPLAWVLLNKTRTENQKLIEFDDHRFLIDIYADMSPDITVIKSAQVGESVERILKAFWCCAYLQANVIYVLPTNNVVKDFVSPKVNPLINGNPHIVKLVKKDSESLKQIGERFLYFKGAFSERDAISISGDILILDELDRMPNLSIVNTYDSRLQASSLGWRWRLSNPSMVGYGVDHHWQQSDQMHWFVRCTLCDTERFIDFESNDGNHYIDVNVAQYVCGSCGGIITDDMRRSGRWVAKYPKRKKRGYWISQMIAPWVSAARILEQHEESNLQFFYNFVLGKAYTPDSIMVDRETILRACAPSTIVKNNVVIGVDQNVTEQIWVACTPEGMFAHGKAKSWEEIEHLKLMYNATVVCDPNPYSVMPKQMSKKYRDWYLCYFKQMDTETIQWKGSVVYADRTKLLDLVALEISESRFLFRERPYELEDYIADWSNIYRTVVESPDGKTKSEWLKKENKLSDYSFATAYARIGLSRMLSFAAESKLLDPDQPEHTTTTVATGRHGTMTDTMGDLIDQAIEQSYDFYDNME